MFTTAKELFWIAISLFGIELYWPPFFSEPIGFWRD